MPLKSHLLKGETLFLLPERRDDVHMTEHFNLVQNVRKIIYETMNLSKSSYGDCIILTELGSMDVTSPQTQSFQN